MTFTAGIIKDPSTGVDIEISTVSAIGLSLGMLNDLIMHIHEVEKTEADAALKRLKWYHCAQKRAFIAAVTTMSKNMSEALMRLDRIFQEHFVPNDSVPEKLMDGHHAKWSEIMTEIDLVQKDIKAQLTLENWESSGAQQYKAALPTQLKALTELRDVATANQQAVEQVALLNGAIFHATESTVMVAHDTLAGVMETYKPKRPKTSFLGLGAGNVKGMYYKNFDLALQLVVQLGDWMERIVKTQGSEWASTATELGQSITTVEKSPANLKPNGGWPSSVAQETPEAFTQALGEHQRALKEQHVKGQQKGIRLK